MPAVALSAGCAFPLVSQCVCGGRALWAGNRYWLPSRVSGEYTAPVGLFGLMITSARVRG